MVRNHENAVYYHYESSSLTCFCLIIRIYRDTVDSVGIIPKRLPFTTSNTIVRTFRHAVALDERRAKFKANLWNRPTATELGYGSDVDAPTPRPKKVDDTLPRPKKTKTKTNDKANDVKANGNAANDIITNGTAPARPPLTTTPTTGIGKSAKSSKSTVPSVKKLKESKEDKQLTSLEKMYSARQDTTDVEEVWFAVSTWPYCDDK